MRCRLKCGAAVTGALLLCTLQARAQIDRATAASGAVHGTDGAHVVRGTIAQSAIGLVAGVSTRAALGFWHTPRSKDAAVNGAATGSGVRATVFDASPNPFADYTELSIRIPRPAEVTLILYDVLGQPVGIPIDGKRIAGTYTVTVPGSDLPAGRYTAILATGTERLTIPLLLVR